MLCCVKQVHTERKEGPQPAFLQEGGLGLPEAKDLG